MLGKTIEVNIGKQADWTDPTTLARKALNVYGVSGGQTENFSEDGINSGGSEAADDPTEPGPGLDDHKITVKGPVCANQMQWWLAAYMGAETASGSSPDYTHTFETGTALPIICKPCVPLCHRYSPCRA